MPKIKRALLSVSDKTDLIPLARLLQRLGVELISTGGTASTLRNAGLQVKQLSDFTGSPEILDGRVKTLHPKVHAALLFRRDNPVHVATVQAQQIEPIDLIVVNLYPFEKAVESPGASLGTAIENIDIGGPSMLRSAAKNYESVTVVTDPGDYREVMRELEERGETTLELRARLAVRVFDRTAQYDRVIARHLQKVLARHHSSQQLTEGEGKPEAKGGEVPAPLTLARGAAERTPLRYGENPHQRAAVFGPFGEYFRQVQGKQLSYNNILDLTAAWGLIEEFDRDVPAVAILKHMNPCGVGEGTSQAEAWDKALATDREAPFGGIIAVNRTLDGECAGKIAEIFSEVIVAPAFSEEALKLFARKKNLRIIEARRSAWGGNRWDVRSVGSDLFLVQERDGKRITQDETRVVTERAPTAQEWEAMLFGWRVVKHVKSNAIVYAGPDRTLGIGAGQASRVEAARLAAVKATQAGLSLKNSVICSDAFFPFPDGLMAAAEAGATAAIQPGGSIKDADVIAAANASHLAMVFTGVRHFRH